MSCYLEEAVHERLGSWGTAGNVNVNGDNSEKMFSSMFFPTRGVHSSPVTSPDDSIGVVVITSAISAAAHTHLDEHVHFGYCRSIQTIE